MKALHMWDVRELKVGDRVQDHDGRLGTGTDAGEAMWSTTYCECCGPEMIGASVSVKWDDTGVEQHLMLYTDGWQGTLYSA